MPADLDAIDERIQQAEYAAIHIANNAGMWLRYYDGGIEKSQLIQDFKQLVRENGELRQKISEMEYKLESAGVRVP